MVINEDDSHGVVDLHLVVNLDFAGVNGKQRAVFEGQERSLTPGCPLKTKPEVVPLVMSPGVAAARLGTSVASLVAIILRGRHHWTEIALGGKPGDRDCNRWGFTEEQFRTIVRDQELVFPELAADLSAPRTSIDSSDGRSRLRPGNLRQFKP